MQFEILAAIISGLLSLLGGSVFASSAVQKIIRKLLRLPEPDVSETFREKLDKLSSNLSQASQEVEKVLSELSQVAKAREEAVDKLEAELKTLEEREQNLQSSIKALENVPLPVAERFAELTASGERRSARRDYILFGLGVVVSTIVTVILKVSFGI